MFWVVGFLVFHERFLGFLFFFALLNGGDIRFLGMVFGFIRVSWWF